MSADPRKYFAVKNCPVASKAGVSEQAKRKGFLESITKIGDLEILNKTGFGKVAEGLRTLSKVSDSVRVGESVVPGREGSSTTNSVLGQIANTALDAVDKGANIVLDTTGLGGVADAVGSFNPDVANRAVGQAKSVYQKVKQGGFKLSDIPGAFQDLQNLEQLGRGIFGTGAKPPKREYEFCGASPYATDLIAYAPKFNFLFVIDVEFAPEYERWSDIGRTMSFVVKRSTRPSVEFEYEEVNMYNFHTRVPKRTIYPPVTMSFYDDNRNAAHLFYTGYTRAMSPIANMMIEGQAQTGKYETSSMEFGGGPDASSFNSSHPSTMGYAASLGPLLGETTSIVQRIRLYHVFDYGRLMNIYNFYNPRILAFNQTDLNMAETGDGAEFDFQFAYDSMFIEPGFSIQEGGNNKNLEELTNNGNTATYPIKPIFNDDDDPMLDNSQQPLGAIAQFQAEEATENNYVARTVDNFKSASTAKGASSGGIGGLVDSVTSGVSSTIGGITGGINDAIGGVTGAVTNSPLIKNVTKGVTGAMNDSVASVQKVTSNAFTSAKNFAGSVFG